MTRSARNGMTAGKKAAIIFTTVLITAFVAILVVNLAMGDKEIDRQVESLYRIDDPQFMRTMGSMLGPAILSGNRVETLVNGDQIFPAMLKAIAGARRSITFETYIYWSGTIGRTFADALIARARAGVKVHVLLDWVGSGKIDDKLIEELEAAGVEVRRYNPPRWYTFGRFNNRTHRKLLVVDGGVGFTGGVGIADPWTGNAQDPNHWRETHFRLEGPVVAQMQAAFHDNWVEVTGAVLHGEDYFPALRPAGTQYGQVFTSSPRGGGDSMHLMYLLSIASAAKTIQLSASYFVPDNVAVDSLVAAIRRGVKIQIILPGPLIDSAVVRRASRSTWGPLLRAGVEIYEYQPTMFHCKVMVVDEVWTSVGSTNFDNRSFAVNDEANLNVYDREFARVQVRLFEEDLKRSRRITLEEWENRPWTAKLWEHTLGVFSSQL